MYRKKWVTGGTNKPRSNTGKRMWIYSERRVSHASRPYATSDAQPKVHRILRFPGPVMLTSSIPNNSAAPCLGYARFELHLLNGLEKKHPEHITMHLLGYCFSH